MSAFIVGLTGGIGSGKSVVAESFAAHGIRIIDADVVAHMLTAADGAAIPAIRTKFGTEIIASDGSLDRAAMRKLVFADANARKQLEAILHPMIRAECDRLCREADSPYVILVVPLLIESAAYRQRISRLAVVDCPEEIQIARAMARSHLTRSEVERIMAAQTTRQARLAAADDVINNTGSRDELKAQIAELHQTYLNIVQNC